MLAASLLALSALAGPATYPADDERAFMSDFNRTRQAIYSDLDAQVLPTDDVYVGDSNFDRLNIDAVDPDANAVQMAIAGNNTLAVCRQLEHYTNAPTVAAVLFVHVTTNDAHVLIATKPWTLEDTLDAIDCILEARGQRPLVWAAAHHVSTEGTLRPGVPVSQVALWNAMIDDINGYVEQRIAADFPLAVYLHSPLPEESLGDYLADGLHLNNEGRALWLVALRNARAAALSAAQQP